MNQTRQQNQQLNYTTQSGLQQLNRLSSELDQHSKHVQQNLQSYIQIYVKMQGRCQDFFTAFCEHEVIQKMFGAVAMSLGSMKTLQLFNLILANTNQANSLIYLFSQPALHMFLFQRFNIERENPQSVQYYIQLIKAIILKMRNGHTSLIKLFCNNRYSSFPLLCQITYLAVHAQQQLVKVTAQQCVLLLISLLNQKKVGCGYLAEIQMGVFFHELTLNICEKDSDTEGYLKYIIDLLVALKDNCISRHMLLNAFVTNVILKSIHRLSYILQIVRIFSELMMQCVQLPRQISQQIKLILARIICNLCFNKFLNSTYVTTMTKISQSCNQNKQRLKQNKTLHATMLKYYTERFKTILPYIQEVDKQPDSQIDLSILLQGWLGFNGSSQVNRIKQNKQRSKSGIFGFFSSKPDPNELYLKSVTNSIGIKYSDMRFPLFKISATIDFSTAIYFVQAVLVKQQIKSGNTRMRGFQQYEVHFNDNRGQFQLNQHFCQEVLKYINIIQKTMASLDKEVSYAEIKNVELQYNFLICLKQYFSSNLCDYLLLVQHQYSIKQISLMSKMLRSLNLNKNFQKKTLQKLLWKLQQIQSQINQLTFKNDFKSLIQYVLNNQYQKLLMKTSTKNIQRNNGENIAKKMFKYQFIKQLIDPQSISLRPFIMKKWIQHIQVEANHNKLSLNRFNLNGCQIRISTKSTMIFQVQIKAISLQNPVIFQMQQQSIFESMFHESRIYFTEFPEGIHFSSKQQFQIFKQDWHKVCSLREEVITKSILLYFQNTHSHLCNVMTGKNLGIKGQNQKIFFSHKSYSI